MAQHVTSARLANTARDVLLESNDGIRCRVFSLLKQPLTIPSAMYVAVRVPSMRVPSSGPAATAAHDIVLMDPLTRSLLGRDDVLEIELDSEARVSALVAQTPAAAQPADA